MIVRHWNQILVEAISQGTRCQATSTTDRWTPPLPLSAMSNENACPICLEPLLQGVIGTVVPCGHCFHQECWEAWSSNGKHQQGRGVKCAMCNEGSKLFCRIFLEMDHSTQDDFENEDDDSSSDHCTNSQKETLAKVNKYKRRAKQLKQRVKVLESQRKQQAREHRKLVESYDNTRCHVVELETTAEELESELEKSAMHLHDARLQLVRNERELETTKSSLADYKVKFEEVSTKFQSMESRFEKKLKEAQAASLAEVQHILLEHPKLCDENRKLKEQLVRSKSDLVKCKQRSEGSSTTVCNFETPTSRKDSREAARKRKLLQAVAQSRDIYNESQRQQAKQEHREELQKQLHNKVSVQAARMSRASEKTSKASASDVVDFLESMKPPLSSSRHLHGKRNPFENIALPKQPQKKAKMSASNYFDRRFIRSK